MKFDEIVIDPKNQRIIVKKMVIDNPPTFKYLTSRSDIDYVLETAIIVGANSLSSMDLPEITNPISEDGKFPLTQDEINQADKS